MIIRFRVTRIMLITLVLFSVNRSAGQSHVGEVKCICIDAGHGGRDPGACGLISYEKNIVLNIALKLGKLIKEEHPGIKVVYTRDKDVLIDLDKRGKIANDNKADLFISIHTNSNDSKVPHGMETYVLGLHRSKENLQVAMKENSVIKYEKDYSVKYAGFDPNRAESYIIFSFMQNLYLEKSLKLASLIQGEMVANTGKANRGVRQAGYLVLKDAAMPAILVEAGFISNPVEERYLNTRDAQDRIAASICRAVSQYKAAVEKNNNLLSNKRETPANNEDVVQQTDNADNIERKGESIDKLFYAVQVASAPKQIKDKSVLCKGENVCELPSGGRFRYYVAQSADFEEVKKNLQKIKNKVQGCFVIAIYKGDVIPVGEARKLE